MNTPFITSDPSKVSIQAEIPEGLKVATQYYLERHPGWDQDRLIEAAIALFLCQNSSNEAKEFDRYASRLYLDAMFERKPQ